MSDKEYFTGFAWAVGKAFKDALASCHFEQGDVLYDTPKAYEGTWSDALQHLKFSIQVKFPPGGTKTQREQDVDSIFENNWRQRVEVDLWEYPSKKKRSVVTTQGRLYMTLWEGELSFLNLGTPEPPVPTLPREALKELAAAEKYVVQKYGKADCIPPSVSLCPMTRRERFYERKGEKLRVCLKGEFPFRLDYVLPRELGLPKASSYLPTLNIACFIIDTSETNRVYSCLKSALYSRAGKQTGADRFRLEVHGCMVPGTDDRNRRVHDSGTDMLDLWSTDKEPLG